ncbi:E3 Ubiquitin ligase [Thermomonospora echinospora]|uniref:RING-type E3 ubiquitin transferase n=1 Tax=Thermomonospora echinospora TaxID=1992 RepID=A0A1H6CU74_9ACTN|nr:GIDE domain-containing protein [Thermomonospora echinospora]SEG76502.1 E3 Ubiquitin ligase [Thermomonospora echinospora]
MYILVAIFAAVFLAVGWVGRMQYTAMLRTVTLTCAQLTVQAPFSAKCEVTGTVRGPAGPMLTAPFSGTPCVWYRVRATAKHRTGSDNEFHKEDSEAPFEVWDGTGAIEVFPEGKNIDGTVKSFDAKVSPGNGGALPTPAWSPDQDKEYHYEEWTLPVGSALYARGTAMFDGRRLVMRAPGGHGDESDPYILSTRSEKQLRRRALALMLVGYVVGALLVVLAGVVAVIESNGD